MIDGATPPYVPVPGDPSPAAIEATVQAALVAIRGRQTTHEEGAR